MPKLLNMALSLLLKAILVLLVFVLAVLLVRLRITLIISCKVPAMAHTMPVPRNMVIRRVAMLIRRLWRVSKQIVYASFQRRLRSSRLLISGVRGCASCVLRIRECLTRSVFSFFRGKKSSGLIT